MALCLVEDRWSEADRKLVEKSHNLKQLYLRGCDFGFWTGCTISKEFLDYVQDHFERRYSKSEEKVLERRGAIHLGGSVIHTYDDCITQLDDSLCEACGSPRLSLGAAVAAGHYFNERLALSFYHCNPFALSRRPQYEQALAALEVCWSYGLPDDDKLFFCEHLPPPAASQAEYMKLLELRLAEHFRLLGKGEPDPDPARILLSRPFRVQSSGFEWVLAKLREEFGLYNVDAREETGSRVVAAFVFDRTAKKWWRSLALRQNHVPLWIRCPAAEEALRKWIRETQEQFKGKRRSR